MPVEQSNKTSLVDNSRDPTREEVAALRDDLISGRLNPYLLQNPVVVISLTNLMHMANIERAKIEKYPLSTAAKLRGPFYEYYLKDLEEIMFFHKGPRKYTNYRVLHNEAGAIIDFLVKLEENEKFRPQTDHREKHTESLTKLIVKANKFRLQQEKSPLSTSSHFLNRFYEENQYQLPEVFVRDNRSTKNNLEYRVFKTNIDKIITRLIEIERPSWQPVARGQEEAAKFSQEFLYPLFAYKFDGKIPNKNEVFSLVWQELCSFFARRDKPANIEDLAQTTLERLIPFLEGKSGRLGNRNETWSYIYTTARYVRFKFLEKQNKLKGTALNQKKAQQPDDLSQAPDNFLQWDSEILSEFAALLSSQEQTVCQLTLSGLTDLEIAETIAVQQGRHLTRLAVRSSRHRARKKFKAMGVDTIFRNIGQRV